MQPSILDRRGVSTVLGYQFHIASSREQAIREAAPFDDRYGALPVAPCFLNRRPATFEFYGGSERAFDFMAKIRHPRVDRRRLGRGRRGGRHCGINNTSLP
jgi:hypothetical protein